VKMGYDTMDAGREMDAMVAEKVMGWKRGGKGDHTKPLHYKSLDHPGEIRSNWAAKGEHDYLVSPDGGVHYLCVCAGEDTKDHIDLPGFSTSISAAWEVVEKMDLFDNYCLGKCQDGDYGIFHNDEEEHGSTPIASASTAPLTICRAALKAVEP